MKANNLVSKTFLAIAMVGILMTGCKKNDDTNAEDNTDDTAEQMVNAGDESRVSSENDEAIDEVNQVALSNARFRGAHIFNGIIPCGASIDSAMASQGTITINFTGNNCANTRSRTGSITLQLPYNATTMSVTPWTDAGCVLTVTFNAFKVTRLSDNKSQTYNGTKTITNVNGGIVDDAPDFVTPIVHLIQSTSMQVAFDNGTTRTWNIDRTRTINRASNITTVSVTGNATQGGFSNVSIWGINRKGNTFYLNIPTPVVLSSACSYHAMSGVRIHHGVVRDLTVTYGVDASGNAVTTGCPYGYRLNWIGRNGNAKQVGLSRCCQHSAARCGHRLLRLCHLPRGGRCCSLRWTLCRKPRRGCRRQWIVARQT